MCVSNTVADGSDELMNEPLNECQTPAEEELLCGPTRTF